MDKPIQSFTREVDFEEALTQHLLKHGWNEVINHPTEQTLVENWASIIYQNNQRFDQLDKYPLTETEMEQIIYQVNQCHSPYEMSQLINGRMICIKRDCVDDTRNCGKNVYLKLFDPAEIAAGQSVYQIVRQPHFRTKEVGDRRGDVMLLINGMPVIHIELKRSDVDVTQACYQIKRYAHEGVFAQGIYSMVQIFVAMTPESTRYFANPGEAKNFRPEFFFHWADSNNEEVTNWQLVAADLLSIPMAHQLIGYYTIADDKDRVLKVLRSYQYYATNKICDKVRQNQWDNHQHRGGYVWHTTGSGKTMTSFKSAQLIAESGHADKVVFLLDRVELSIQSLDEYRGFADDALSIQDTADTRVLCAKLLSKDPDDRLIVTSLQKMANVKEGGNIAPRDLEAIKQKRLVFIVDECHRSTFGEMLMSVKNTFTRALLFGFTGTPVFNENAKHEIKTETIFGEELHKYTISNGIKDGNVLGFDPLMVQTFKDAELREQVAYYEMEKCLAQRDERTELKQRTAEEYRRMMEEDKALRDIYERYMYTLEMPKHYTENGKTVTGVEAKLPPRFYESEKHHRAVAQDIVCGWDRLSHNSKFHAMLATKNIPEAIAYYRLFKSQYPSLNVVAVFDQNIDNSDEGIVREDALVEMLKDYNARYGTTFELATYAKYKKDVAKRLAHKWPYTHVAEDHSQQVDLLIVVTQMLTGYDSKWINTLYVDKEMTYVNLIQAFSRTNRLFGPDKPHGIIKYYSYPHTMKQHIEDALEVYADRQANVFVDRLEHNLQTINSQFLSIREIFHSHQLMRFEALPTSRESCNMFAKLFSQMTHKLEAARLQGFTWDRLEYEFEHGDKYTRVVMELDEETYQVLLQRYRELLTPTDGPRDPKSRWEFPIDTYIVETGTGTIDAEYLDSKFQKYVKKLYREGPEGEVTQAALEELSKTFATLDQKDQELALFILHDIQCGDLRLERGKTFYDYLGIYRNKQLHQDVVTLHEATGIDAVKLEQMIMSEPTEANIYEFGRFAELLQSMEADKVKRFIVEITGQEPPSYNIVLFVMENLMIRFVIDAPIRKRILTAWLTKGVRIDINTYELILPEAEEDVVDTPTEAVPTEAVPTTPADDAQPTPSTAVTTPAEEERSTEEVRREEWLTVKERVAEVLSETLKGVLRYMRPMDEVVDSVFFVLTQRSLDRLDGVDGYVYHALVTYYTKDAKVLEQQLAFNSLVMKFEAYLKKLYFLINGKELTRKDDGTTVSLSDVLWEFDALWGLKKNKIPVYQELYTYLDIIRKCRNDESHISPTSSREEVDLAVRAATTMYFFATATSITDLESAGYDPQAYDVNALYAMDDATAAVPQQTEAPKRTATAQTEAQPMGTLTTLSKAAAPECAAEDLQGNGPTAGLTTDTDEMWAIAAERRSVAHLSESSRRDLLRRAMEKLLNYGYTQQKSAFSKKRHWEAVYRIAADYGFVNDENYDEFYALVSSMEGLEVPYELTRTFLATINVGVYALPFKHWTKEGVAPRKLAEYNDIRQCATHFQRVVEDLLTQMHHGE